MTLNTILLILRQGQVCLVHGACPISRPLPKMTIIKIIENDTKKSDIKRPLDLLVIYIISLT